MAMAMAAAAADSEREWVSEWYIGSVDRPGMRRNYREDEGIHEIKVGSFVNC